MKSAWIGGALRRAASAAGLAHAPSALPTVLRALPDARARLPELVASVDPALLVLEASRHGLSALLSHELERAGTPLPEPHAEALRRDAMNVVAAGMRVRRLLTRTLDALAAEGIRPVLLKGPAFGDRFYPEPHLRPTGDVDVLVAPEELTAATRALRTLDLAEAGDPGEDDVFGRAHHLSFRGGDGLVELHFRLTSGFGLEAGREAIAPHAVGGEYEGRKVRFLRPEVELVYLAIHAAQHLFLRIGWLYDLKLLALARPIRDDEVAAIAKASGMAGAVHAALSTAREVVGMPVADALLEALGPAVWRAPLVAALFSADAVTSARIPRSRAAAFLVRALLIEDARGVFRHVGDGALRAARRELRATLRAGGRQ